MKRSDALERYKEILAAGKTGSWEYIEAIFIEATGGTLSWDPEEVELPKRIGPEDLHFGGDDFNLPLRTEAAARYNALGRITNKVLGPGKIVRYQIGMPILTILEEEGVTR